MHWIDMVGGHGQKLANLEKFTGWLLPLMTRLNLMAAILLSSSYNGLKTNEDEGVD